MRSLTKALRTAYYEALNGNLSLESVNVPVVDGWNNTASLKTHHVIIKNIIESKKNNTQQSWGGEYVVELDIVTFQYNGFSSDDRDDLEDQILQILFPAIGTIGISVPGYQVSNMEKEGSNDIDEVNKNGSVARKILRIKQDIFQ